jgi:hypothetical protein
MMPIFFGKKTKSTELFESEIQKMIKYEKLILRNGEISIQTQKGTLTLVKIK